MSYLVSLHTRRPPQNIGNKALNLHLLWRNKFRIPQTHVCTWQAYLDYQRDPATARARLLAELEGLARPGQSYAVRSSANLEDDSRRSFAGQFTSLLNVSGAAALLQAIEQVWQAGRSDGVQSYLQHSRHTGGPLCMAVIIQEMVPPALSGVTFSHNPVTGQEETIVEAVVGDGLQLVQAGVSPLRWVSRWGTLLEGPAGDEHPREVIAEVIAQTGEAARRFRRAVDLEWVYDGQALYWVQLRDITALRAGDRYSNRIAREMLPGQIKPLVWSVSTPIHTRQWARILKELVGDSAEIAEALSPERLVKAFHYRAYFNMGQFGRVFASLGMPPDALERMMGMRAAAAGGSKPAGRRILPGPGILMKAPRAAGFIFDKLGFGERAGRNYETLKAQAAALAAPPTSLPASPAAARALLTGVQAIVSVQEQISYHTILSILLMQIYNALLRSALKSHGVDFQQFNLTDGWEALSAFDPNLHLARLNALGLALPAAAQVRLRQEGPAARLDPALVGFFAAFDEFLARFGHLSDSTVDFTAVPWRETPELILRLALDFQAPPASPGRRVSLDELRAGGLRKRYLSWLYARARQFRLLREMFSSLYTQTLGLLRERFRLLGEWLVAQGRLAAWEEVYLLYFDELQDWADGRRDGADFADLAIQRRSEMDASRNATLPEVIYGNQAPPLISAEAVRLQGVPTSGGYYSGRVNVVRGLSDFHKVQSGDVLVIPYSDVSWTPLFAKAGAVIAESGGILSHSSIIAREYNIPAVVSVTGAMDLCDGDLVQVDGFKGLVVLGDGANASR
jgi:pyruvate,water dikinase